jgi:hypothetical protein
VVALPRVAAHLGVKDEAGLIDACLDQLRLIGVADVVVHDLASRDGTRDRLRARAGEGLRVIDMPETAREADLWDSLAAALAALGSDWVLMLDADEFPLPRGGDIRAVLAGRDEAALALPRHNVVLGPGGARAPLPPGRGPYGDVWLHMGPAGPAAQGRLETEPTLAWLRTVPLPKLAVRPGAIGGFGPGLHRALPRPGARLAAGRAEGVIVAHLPMTGFDRFAAKVANIGATLARHGDELGPGFAWHWRRWVGLAAAGRLHEEWERSLVGDDELCRLEAAGEVRRAEELLGP